MKVKDEILARMYVLLTLLALAPVLVAVQIVRINLVEGPTLRAQGASQATRTEILPAMRGPIVDRHGRTLVVNTARYDVAVDPGVDGFGAHAGQILEILARHSGTSVTGLRAKIRERTSRRYVLLARGVPEIVRDRLVDLDAPGLIVTSSAARRYSYGPTAAHLVGHVSVDLEGLAGVEGRYDDRLRGTNGWRSVQLDRRRVVRYESDPGAEPEHGETLVLTIDLVRQTILEEELERGVVESGATWGTAVAMDPRSGAILALANHPTFDPNRAGEFPETARRNHAVADRLEPGSTFKLVGAVAAIEEGTVTLEDTVDTGPGTMVIHGITLRDTRAHGRIPFSEVISESSNIGISRVSEGVGREAFYRYARSLGFGTPTWVDLPGEVSGLLKKPSEWSGTTLSAMSRGYEVEATPLQLVVAYGALANGGTLVRPFVVAERRDVTGRVVWRASQDSVRRAFRVSTARKLLPAFEQAVASGTGRRASVDGVRIAGKTGTAWKTLGGSYAAGAYRASFVGFFPVEDPEVVMIVVLDEPAGSAHGGAAAAPVFRRVVERWRVTMPSAAEGAEPLPDPDGPRAVTDVTELPARLAVARLVAAGLRSRVDKDETALIVTAQDPGPGASARGGQRIALSLGETAGERMPDATGLTVREAAWFLTSLGITPTFEGTGRVRSQSPPAGSPKPREAVLRCR